MKFSTQIVMIILAHMVIGRASMALASIKGSASTPNCISIFLYSHQFLFSNVKMGFAVVICCLFIAIHVSQIKCASSLTWNSRNNLHIFD